MITTALELAGRDPSAVIGGKLPLIHGYGKAGKGDDIVIEACEFAETFLKLTPYLSVVLNIDNDHLDYYGSMGELKFAFKRFCPDDPVHDLRQRGRQEHHGRHVHAGPPRAHLWH